MTKKVSDTGLKEKRYIVNSALRIFWYLKRSSAILFLVTSEGAELSVEAELKTSNFYRQGHSSEEVDLVPVWIDGLPYKNHMVKVLEANPELNS